ncbi:hypothetical protein BH10BAC5_BH10BAC5_05980 [soil metagenome]
MYFYAQTTNCTHVFVIPVFLSSPRTRGSIKPENTSVARKSSFVFILSFYMTFPRRAPAIIMLGRSRNEESFRMSPCTCHPRERGDPLNRKIPALQHIVVGLLPECFYRGSFLHIRCESNKKLYHLRMQQPKDRFSNNIHKLNQKTIDRKQNTNRNTRSDK